MRPLTTDNLLLITKRKGFTLIELLVVITIIAILTVLVAVNLEKARTASRDAQRKTDLSRIAMALNNYKADGPTKSYITSITSGSTPDWVNISTGLTALNTGSYSYLKPLPTDPLNDSTHYYSYMSDTVNFKILVLSESIDPPSGGACSPAQEVIAKNKAGEFYDRISRCNFLQISSSDILTSGADW